MDGANVEIHEAVGAENIIIFGMDTKEVTELRRSGYTPINYYHNNAEIHQVIEFINKGIGGKTFGEISGAIVHHDPYMALADFADYRSKNKLAIELHGDADKWNRMSLMNIAGSGIFAADRSINDYARDIWHVDPIKLR